MVVFYDKYLIKYNAHILHHPAIRILVAHGQIVTSSSLLEGIPLRKMSIRVKQIKNVNLVIPTSICELN